MQEGIVEKCCVELVTFSCFLLLVVVVWRVGCWNILFIHACTPKIQLRDLKWKGETDKWKNIQIHC
jgi:hypothetical protein